MAKAVTAMKIREQDIPSYFAYWGKAKRDPEEPGPDYHLLTYHCLDVAAVGSLLFAPERSLCQTLANQLGVSPEWLQEWFSFCLMLHDLGKFFRAFQNLAPNLSSQLVPFDVSCDYKHRHDSLGFALWQKVLVKSLADVFPMNTRRVISGWLKIVCGHHGQPPKEDIQNPLKFASDGDAQVAEQFVRELILHWLPDLSPLVLMDKKALASASWQLAGVAVLSDWLGSDKQVFQYCDQPQSLESYWREMALPRAAEVLARSPFQPKHTATFRSISQQFDFIAQPTPLQALSQKIELSAGSQLFLLEDVTGAGKTEAAMVLVHRLLGAGLAEGLFVGLPTMATANAMYERLTKSYRSLYGADELPSLVLAHGARQLSKAFTDSVRLCEQGTDKSYGAGEQSASAYCNQWLADSNKKALLADVGVGTIDQALLAVLPSRHQSLRLLGLQGKVLLLDEVHAYDPYMRRLLVALLQAHAAQGGSVVLLSATLPQQFRRELVAAVSRGMSCFSGANIQAPELGGANAYPLLTQLSSESGSQSLKELPVPTRPSVQRKVAVTRLESEAQTFDVIRQAVAAGRSIGWVRNTVKDARHAYQQLVTDAAIDGAKLTLFHSRFAMGDRQVIETDVLSRFGKNSTPKQRCGQVLIGTQVIEQSLDLDLDILISDLAPIDLLIQRAGRLQRHCRDSQGQVIDGADQRGTPQLYLLSPDPDQLFDKNWLRTLLPGTQAVYAHVGQLWLTARVLLEKGGFTMPDDGRALIEGVYGEVAQETIPEPLIDASFDAQAEDKSRQGLGQFNCLKMDKGYIINSAAHNGGWSEEVNIPTRLTGETVSVVLAELVDGELTPYCDGENHPWALSQLSIPRHEWEKAAELIPVELRPVIDQLKQQQPALKWLEVLPLVAETQHLYKSHGGWNLEQ